jgi:Lon protease-like protein
MERGRTKKGARRAEAKRSPAQPDPKGHAQNTRKNNAGIKQAMCFPVNLAINPNLMAAPQILPLFPLGVVVLPGEEFYLHIFEPRYKQLIEEARDKDIRFGIPFMKNGKILEFGTVVRLKTIFSVYPDGEMDIAVMGEQIFELQELIAPYPERLYNGGISWISPVETSPTNELLRIRPLLLEYLQLKKGEPVKLNADRPISSFDAAGLLNLPPEQKYILIQLPNESERILWIINELRILLQSRKMELQLQNNYLFN